MTNVIKNKMYFAVILIIFVTVTISLNLLLPFNYINGYASGYGHAEIKYDSSDNSSVFPDSYKSYIKELKSKYPNWKIKAVYLNLDWNTSVSKETEGTKSRILDTYPDGWKRLSSASSSDYNAAGWVLASQKAVAYTMDPRNFLTEEGIFQFKASNEDVGSDSQSALDALFNDTVMGSSEYKNKYYNGSSWITMANTYSQIIKNVGTSLNVSPIFIGSRIKQETNGNILNNGSINGKNSTYPGYFNFFNIGANDGTGAVSYGVAMAYKNGWNTPELAIKGGVSHIYNNYIKYCQNTVYFQKFDVNNVASASGLYTYQYMTNILAPYSESQIAYSAYKNSNTLNSSFTFYVPVYDNMPSTSAPYPTSTVTEDNLNGTDIVYLDDGAVNGTDYFNLRSGPGTEHSIVATVIEAKEGADNRTKFVRTQKGSNGWDKIKLANGTEAYVYQSYVKIYNYTHVESVSLDKTTVDLKVGETSKITPTISPSNALVKGVTYESNNNAVASVNSDGTITAKSVGSAKITVKTIDGNKTATCDVNVKKTLATKISTALDTYSVAVDNYLNISPVIEPSNTTDKTVDIAIEDTTVANVENNKIKGIKEGKTKVTLTTKDGSNLKCSFTLNVRKDKITVTDKLALSNDGIVSKVKPGDTAEYISQNVNSSFTIKLFNTSDKEISAKDVVGTGTKVKILENSSILYEYTILVKGDISGDGKITSSDYIYIKNHIMNSGKLDGIKYLSADVNKDGEVTSKDYVYVRKYIMGDTNIITQ